VTAATYQYTYDGNGNLLSQTYNGGTTNYTYNAANEITAAGSTTYTYDANGNMTGNSAGLSLAYNAANMTSSITPPNASAIAMTYTGATQVQRVTAGSTSYQYSLMGLSSQTTSGGTTYFTRTPTGQLVSMRTPSGTYYYLYDGLGSVVGLTDSSGNVVARYSYSPYGTTTSQSGSEATANPWRYAGAYYDSATGLYKMGARYYAPALGRFTQLDPAGTGYAYAAGDPANGTDPSGLLTLGVCGTGSAGIGFGGFVQGCVGIAFGGGHGLQVGSWETVGGGTQTPWWSFGVGGQWSTGDTINQLGGTFAYAGGGGSLFGSTVNADGFYGNGVGGGNVALGLGGAAPVSASVYNGASYTWTQTWW
jgi:RHS repeat-associated protein